MKTSKTKETIERLYACSGSCGTCYPESMLQTFDDRAWCEYCYEEYCYEQQDKGRQIPDWVELEPFEASKTKAKPYFACDICVEYADDLPAHEAGDVRKYEGGVICWDCYSCLDEPDWEEWERLEKVEVGE